MSSGPITSWQIDGETMETVTDFIFLGSKIIADSDCSHEIKKCLLLGRKVMTNLGHILKSIDITLPTKVHIIKAMVFPVVVYRCENWTIKKAECQRIGASVSILPINVQGLFPLGLTCLISLLPKGLKSLLQHHSLKASILGHSGFFMVQLSHPYMTTGKTIALTKRTFVGKVMFLLFNMLSRFVIAFSPRSKHLLIS